MDPSAQNVRSSFTGLRDAEVSVNRLKFGDNTLGEEERSPFFGVLKGILREPMFLLLVFACLVYFLLQQFQEGFALLIALFLVSGISIFQELRSRNAVGALRRLSAAKAKVIREGIIREIPAEDIVKGDFLLIREGELVAADGLLRQANDLFLNESILTGESFPVHKNGLGHEYAYKGTLVSSGSAVVEVTAVGKETQFGKIGLRLASINIPKTPLQQQIASFIRNMAIAGVIAFGLVFLMHFIRSADLIAALLAALTLAMSILPEEIPVAFSTFQALGAFRLLREKIIVKHPQYVETLGSATVICADKTGTITQNLMQVALVYDSRAKQSFSPDTISEIPEELVGYAMWASEADPFDPMEKAIHEFYSNSTLSDERTGATQIHEYPLSGIPPFMTHIFLTGKGEKIIASKGAPESILQHSKLSDGEKNEILSKAKAFASEGYRVLGVGKGIWHEMQWPVSQEEFSFEFLGLIAFQDPPKENIMQTLNAFKNAGIDFKMITGDYPETALAVAKKIGIDHGMKVLTGHQVMQAEESYLQQACRETSIFARMFPEAKLRVIDALKKQGGVVAMTGDGVNDAPALKASHIGIAMGLRGSEAARGAASLILLDDDLGHMVQAIAQGRKIYDNLKKAIRYIISIHIPIILIVVLPLLLGWSFTSVFSPVHVIFLELIMGPTCSIIYENEPMEAGAMTRPPRALRSTFLTMTQLIGSIFQGLGITLGCLGLGFYFIHMQSDESLIRTMIFVTLLISNIFLTWVNRSFQFSILTTLRYRNPSVVWITAVSILLITAILLTPYLRDLFDITLISSGQVMVCLLVAAISTLWVEVVKLFRRRSMV